MMKIVVVIFFAAQGFSCQLQRTSYLQSLSRDLWHELLNHFMPDIWAEKNNCLERAWQLSILAKELNNYDLITSLIKLMRLETAQLRKIFIEPFDQPFYSEVTRTNPRFFIQVLPLKNFLPYYDLDKDYAQVYLKICGGVIRKHIFMTAMKYHHEELVIYLWQRYYERKVKSICLRYHDFSRLSAKIAEFANYPTIYNDCQRCANTLDEVTGFLC